MGPAEVTGPGGLDHFSSPLRLRWMHVERAQQIHGHSSLFLAIHNGEATESHVRSWRRPHPGYEDLSTTLLTVQGSSTAV